MCVWSIARASRSRNSFSTLPRQRVTATNSNGTAKTGTPGPASRRLFVPLVAEEICGNWDFSKLVEAGILTV